MAKRPDFDSLAIVPSIVAEVIIDEPYAMQEFSEDTRSQHVINHVERLRQAMTPEQKRLFADTVQTMSRRFYEVGERHISTCLEMGDIDQFRVWVRHWMVAFVNNPIQFAERHKENAKV